ncbi:MAG: hypothetical protein A3F83_07435 [Candidatus Glassbacteria bacterium RIFCSPLOWO2_12_FULL_58_11]|uniref:Magnesium transporter MgtE intracellular domain-containing protein n=2 Tax=Candidatus Glassiibacteriota TaxID=1817805 RepID=A0A1F5YM64_9BACT|nr:MAG: hypothetical protein A2Z86_02050 [Candidatus Glassbacteria bacterium GWA2_58_10]OGG00972.1 MAG: hypothetical protein A3F83_07435 [Candidatus Glassbacteria bacterium RIFCSPLOWO2_12_FULL_58_11]
MTKLLQFVGGFILSFLLIVGLFTGIIWYNKSYTPPPQPGVNIDSLLAAGVLPDSLNMYDKERYQIEQEKAKIDSAKAEQARRDEEITQRQAMLEDIQKKMDKSSAEEDSVMNLKYTEVAKLIESMKPVDAGAVMDGLPDFSAAKILTRMSKRQAGRVMSVMSPAKLVTVSQLITLLKE